ADHRDRMEQHREVERLATLVDGEKRRVGELATSDVCRQVDAPDRPASRYPLELFERERRILDGQGRAADEAVRERRVGLCQRIVDELGELRATFRRRP